MPSLYFRCRHPAASIIGNGLTPGAGGDYIAYIEDLFLPAESENFGFARYECNGYWNVGMLEYWLRRNEIFFRELAELRAFKSTDIPI